MNTLYRGHAHGIALAAALAATGCGEQAVPPEDEPGGGGSVTAWTAVTELFFEYPPLIAEMESDPWAIHLTVLDGFQPVTEGVLTLHMVAPNGRTVEVTAEAPVRPGIYTPTVTLPQAGVYDLAVRISGDQVTDTIPAGVIRVYGSASDLPTEPPEAPTGIPFLKEQQWPIRFATHPAVRRSVARTIAVPGVLVPTPDRLAHVAAPVAGLVLANANRGAPTVGDRVSPGTTLAVLAPTDDQGSYAALVARAERLERDVARAERLYAAEAIALKRLEESRHELETARAALAALGGSTGRYELVLRAPIPGVVADRRLAVGARVEPGDLLFTIVDTDVLWLRLQVPASHAAALAGVTAATFTVEGEGDSRRAGRLVSVGTVIDPARRTLPVVFEVPDPVHSLKAGALVTSRLLLDEMEQGIAVPASAVRDEDGVPVAYVQVGGELFQRRILELGPSDGEWTIVRSGLAAAEHVVTEGAYQVRLASLNPEAVGDHGHPH